MMRICHPKIQKGFTLIEIIAALAIIGLGLVGILSLFPVGIDASKRAGDLTQATALGQSLIEQIRSAANKGDLTLQKAKQLFKETPPQNFNTVPDKDRVIPIEDDRSRYLPEVAADTLYQYQVKFADPMGLGSDDSTGEPFEDLADVGLQKVTVIVSWPANESDIALRNTATLVTLIKFPEMR
jgi:prepilin-type N-terminal cleavage/methylation domain-containing protein